LTQTRNGEPIYFPQPHEWLNSVGEWRAANIYLLFPRKTRRENCCGARDISFDLLSTLFACDGVPFWRDFIF